MRRLRFLDSHEAEKEWQAIAPLFEKVVKKAAHGEFSVDDLRNMALKGVICVGVANGDMGAPQMAMAFELVDYPSGRKAVNVLAMGGTGLDEFMRRFWKPFQAWARSYGIDWIECQVSPAMERIHRRYGFRTVYRTMRKVPGDGLDG